ncbi:hypothetical protein BKA61DRAFT_681044 [Leptodontidium sp. MPI-SDFR-AT-0119]|nr:hypothetical protein BKA61DRAFT_681044 [Leptodontidium sp. MPI-SDFR-AT-0119]
MPEPVYEQNDDYNHPLSPGGSQINNEDYLAAHLLYVMHQGEEESIEEDRSAKGMTINLVHV